MLLLSRSLEIAGEQYSSWLWVSPTRRPAWMGLTVHSSFVQVGNALCMCCAGERERSGYCKYMSRLCSLLRSSMMLLLQMLTWADLLVLCRWEGWHRGCGR